MHFIPLAMMEWLTHGHVTQAMSMRCVFEVLFSVVENVGSCLSTGVGQKASLESLVGILQIPRHRGVEKRKRERQSSWIQPFLKLFRAIPRLFSYMSQKIFEILLLATQRVLKTSGWKRGGEEDTQYFPPRGFDLPATSVMS